MAADAELLVVKNIMIERESMAEEIDGVLRHLRETFKNTEKLSIDQQKIIENLEEELQ